MTLLVSSIILVVIFFSGTPLTATDLVNKVVVWLPDSEGQGIVEGTPMFENDQRSATQPASARWRLVWSDEFNGAVLDTTKWTYDVGGTGWGNNEDEFYTKELTNVRVEDGNLVIEAKEQSYYLHDYTSGRIKTQGLASWTYGRIEARIKIPIGQGVWPAFWMLGEDITTNAWPRCGEIDIMENIGSEPNTIYATLHGPGYSGGNGIGHSFKLDRIVSDDFHVFAVDWLPGEIHWYVDDVLYKTITKGDVPGQWVYDHPFFIILNVAVGGNWPGDPNPATAFPQQMLVDYVRVYQP